MNEPSQKFVLIQSILEDPDNVLSVKDLCALNAVSRSGYYAWVKAEETRKRKEQQDERDFDLVLKAYKQGGYTKGAERINATLLHFDPPVVMNVKKIRRLMKKFHLLCPVRKANPYRRMAKALRTSNVAKNELARRFEDTGPRTVLLTDITYIPYNGKMAYLSVILDAYTKEILSWVLSKNLEIDFVLQTVLQLVENHGPELKDDTLIHSDQGCHYTSHQFIELLHNSKVRQSMSRKGNCWDNAPQESFFGHMKDEIKDKIKSCKTFDEVHSVISDWLYYYNNHRYQWRLAKLSPVEFHQYVKTGIYPVDGVDAPKTKVGTRKKKSDGAKPHKADDKSDK